MRSPAVERVMDIVARLRAEGGQLTLKEYDLATLADEVIRLEKNAFDEVLNTAVNTDGAISYGGVRGGGGPYTPELAPAATRPAACPPAVLSPVAESPNHARA